MAPLVTCSSSYLYLVIGVTICVSLLALSQGKTKFSLYDTRWFTTWSKAPIEVRLLLSRALE